MNYTSDIKEIKEFKLAKSAMYNFVLAIFITLALAVAAMFILKLRLNIVLSDSMAPEFYKHDIVVVIPADDYKVNDIIEYKAGFSKTVTHRIVAKSGTGKNAVYTTDGDNVVNGIKDTVRYDQVEGKVIGVLSEGEFIYDFIRSNYFLIIDIVLGTWVLTSIISSENEMRKHNIAKD